MLEEVDRIDGVAFSVEEVSSRCHVPLVDNFHALHCVNVGLSFGDEVREESRVIIQGTALARGYYRACGGV